MMELVLQSVMIIFKNSDITKENVDAIVNAANSYLKHGGGVAGAIVKAGGYEIQLESDEYVSKHGPIPPGGVAVTSAGRLPAKFIIHTVGPVGNSADGDEILRNCFINVFNAAKNLSIKSVAIPFIGTGIFGYPVERFIKVVSNLLPEYFKNYTGPLETVIFCDIDREKIEKLYEALKKVFINPL
uniref:Macro domain-containing protein n=1 Tax=Fervidobacterium thailandense TaxID=1008305 RepID=A0A7C4CDT8_9BACT